MRAVTLHWLGSLVQATRRSKVGRWALGSSLAVGLAIGVVGVAHTPFGRPLLPYLGLMPGCPLSLDNADPGKVERFRRAQLLAHAGPLTPGSRPALGFELGRSTRSQVAAWLKQNGAHCKDVRSGSVVRCSGPLGLPSASDIEDVHFQFNAADRLVAVDLFRKGNCGAQALAHLAELEHQLTSQVGPATSRNGLADATYLDSANLNRVGVEFRYSDYQARLSAMNFGDRGVRVRESYQFSGG